MRDQACLNMWLQLKGGGVKPKTHRAMPSTQKTDLIGDVQSPKREGITLVEQRRSRRLHLKRPREAQEDSDGIKVECCPLSDEELNEKNDKSVEGLISCCTCGRRFHPTCSGAQKGWEGHYNLQCRDKGLDCSPTAGRCKAKGKARAKKTSRKVAPPLQKQKMKTSASILRWVVVSSQDAWSKNTEQTAVMNSKVPSNGVKKPVMVKSVCGEHAVESIASGDKDTLRSSSFGRMTSKKILMDRT